MRLLGEQAGEFVECHIAEVGVVAGGQHAARTQAAGDKARDAGGFFAGVASLAGDLRGFAVDLNGALAQSVLVQGAAVGAECVGLDGFRAGVQEGVVNGADDIRARHGQVVNAILESLAAKVRGNVRS